MAANRQVIKPPRPLQIPGKPARDPNRGGTGALAEGGGRPDFSSRLPGQPFKERPTNPTPDSGGRQVDNSPVVPVVAPPPPPEE